MEIYLAMVTFPTGKIKYFSRMKKSKDYLKNFWKIVVRYVLMQDLKETLKTCRII
jgi:hypothetical protein